MEAIKFGYSREPKIDKILIDGTCSMAEGELSGNPGKLDRSKVKQKIDTL